MKNKEHGDRVIHYRKRWDFGGYGVLAEVYTKSGRIIITDLTYRYPQKLGNDDIRDYINLVESRRPENSIPLNREDIDPGLLEDAALLNAEKMILPGECEVMNLGFLIDDSSILGRLIYHGSPEEANAMFADWAAMFLDRQAPKTLH